MSCSSCELFADAAFPATTMRSSMQHVSDRTGDLLAYILEI